MSLANIALLNSSTTWPNQNQRADLNNTIVGINNVLSDLRAGTTILPRNITMVNNRSVTIAGGNLVLQLGDIPDAASNTYVRNTFTTMATVNYVNSGFNTINASIAIVNTAAINANIAMRNYVNAQIVNANGYSDTQVGNVLQHYTGNITAGNLSVAGNVRVNGSYPVTSSVPRNITVSSSAPTAGQGNIGDIWYQI